MLTHYHEDHAGNAALLANRGIPLTLAPRTRQRLSDPAAIRAYRRIVWGSPQPLPVSANVVDAPEALTFVPTPGHSDDHHVVWDPRTSTLFSGDLWLGVRARVMHVSENPYRILESLRAALALRPTRMFDAHRGAVRDPAEAIAAKIGFLENTIAAIETKIASGWTDRAILRAVLGGDERVALASGGEYSRLNLVRAVRRGPRSDLQP
jgi:glyoxylase-like metal-dependent hydrolase (beta-lactamase superfamily II)